MIRLLARNQAVGVLVGLLLVSGPATAAPDGTYAQWSAQAWGVDRVSLALSQPTADPDGDGIANFLEYALGLDPTRPDAELAPRWLLPSGAATPFELDFAASKSAREAQLTVQWQKTLATSAWLSADGTNLSLTNTDSGAAASFYSARFLPMASQSGFAGLSAMAVVAPPATKTYVWFEAEPPNGEANALLSGGQMTWLNPGGKIQKTITIPVAGTYTLWARKFWNGQSFQWRVGATDTWKSSGNPQLQDLVVLGPGRQVGWMNLGDVALTAGSKAFSLEVTDPSGITAYDCFLLIQGSFTPRGKLKPDDTLSVSETGWSSFQPEADPFDYSPIDLRRLNERHAGDGGFIAAQRESFVHSATGEPVRFWAVNTGGATAEWAKSDIDLFARTLAKRGVNLVRVIGSMYVTSGPNFGQLDTNHIARLHYLIAAFKREGIYTCLNVYYPLFVTLDASNTNFPGYTGKNPFALLYFNQAFQNLYRSWWTYLMNTTNLHTGLAIKDDPAVAMVEMVNEDSILFWTFNPDAGAAGNIPDAQRAFLETQFGSWLLNKYPGKTLAQIRASAWGGLAVAQDNLAAGRPGFRPLWNIANERTKRDQDTVQFLIGIQQQFYKNTYDYIKTTLGCRPMIYASNWQTASPQYLDPLDKWSCSYANFMDRHGYFGGIHTGDASGYAIQAGQQYNDRTALNFRSADGLTDDFTNPLFDTVYNGQPSTITEVNWTPPNRFRADFPFLAAAYGALQGSDAIFQFAAGAPAWDSVPGKFSVQTPALFAQSPAAALVFRQGLVKPAPQVVSIQLALADLKALKGGPVPAAQNFNQLRPRGLSPGSILTNVSAVDSLAYLVGKVGIQILTNGTPESQVLDLSPYLNRTNKVARSQTGELEWNWGAGLVKMSAPAAQGVTGFLGAAGSIDLPDITITSPVEYGTVLVVSLDQQPLAVSGRLLVQIMTEEKPYGWATDAPTGLRTITNAGAAPIMVRNFAGAVILKRADASSLRVTALDANGYRVGSPTTNASTINLNPSVFYYLVER